MTTLTLRVNLYDKSLEPVLSAEPETIAVGEAVKLRLLGLGLTAAQANASDNADRPALRARLCHAMGDVAMYPFPGELAAWTEETVGDATALCCPLDLATVQAFDLFGGPLPVVQGAARVRLYVESPIESGAPALYASHPVKLLAWPQARRAGARELPPVGKPAMQGDLDALARRVEALETAAAHAAFLPLSGGTVTGDVLREKTVVKRVAAIAIRGGYWYLENLDSETRIELTVPDVGRAREGQTFAATFERVVTGDVRECTATVGAVDSYGFDVGIALPDGDGTLHVGPVLFGGETDPVLRETEISAGRMRYTFDAISCQWSQSEEKVASPFVTRADLEMD